MFSRWMVRRAYGVTLTVAGAGLACGSRSALFILPTGAAGVSDGGGGTDARLDVPVDAGPPCRSLHLIAPPTTLFDPTLLSVRRPRATFRGDGALDVVVLARLDLEHPELLLGSSFAATIGLVFRDGRPLLEDPWNGGGEVGSDGMRLATLEWSTTGMHFRTYEGSSPPPTSFSVQTDSVIDKDTVDEYGLGVAWDGDRWLVAWVDNLGSIRRAVIAEVDNDGQLHAGPSTAVGVATIEVSIAAYARGFAWVGLDPDDALEIGFRRRGAQDQFVRLPGANRPEHPPAIVAWPYDPTAVAVAWREGPTASGPPSIRFAVVREDGTRPIEFARPVAAGMTTFDPALARLGGGLVLALPVFGDAEPLGGYLRFVAIDADGHMAPDELALPIRRTDAVAFEAVLTADTTHVAAVWTDADPRSSSASIVRGALLGCLR